MGASFSDRPPRVAVRSASASFPSDAIAKRRGPGRDASGRPDVMKGAARARRRWAEATRGVSLPRGCVKFVLVRQGQLSLMKVRVWDTKAS